MNENDPRLKLTMNGQEFECSRENTSMFTFIGHLAMYDHIFVLMDEETNSGAYLFKENQKAWQEMAGYLIEYQFPMHLNMTEVGQCDVDAFERTMFDDLRSTDTFPEEWVTPNGEA